MLTSAAANGTLGEVKSDFKKQIASYSATRGIFEIVTVPTMQFLMIDGHGDPNTSASYREALQTVYPVAYTLKFFSRNELGRDHVVMPLEALWWAQDMEAFTGARDKSRWSWTAMIMIPEWITGEHWAAGLQTVERKGGAPALEAIRLEPLDEGTVVQTMHMGPYDDEGPVLQRMHHEFVPANGLALTGKHHEIYLSDARRTAPDRLRTILRQPVIEQPR